MRLPSFDTSFSIQAHRLSIRLLAVLLCTVALTACGGGDGATEDNGSQPGAGADDGGGSGGGTQDPDAPIANAGSSATVPLDDLVATGYTLDGSGSSDPNQDALTYQWTVLAKPDNANVVIFDSSQAVTGFFSAQPGEYKFELTVTDPDGRSQSATVTITVTASGEPPTSPGSGQPPVSTDPVISVAPLAEQPSVGDTVTLDASASSDPGSLPLTYSWQLISAPDNSAPPTTLTGATQQITFDTYGQYRYELTVDNGQKSSVQVIEVDVNPYQRQPLNFAVTDAEYDAVGGRIVILSESQVVVVNAQNMAQTQIDLPLPGVAVAVSPSGQSAAVAHNGWLSYLDLQTGTRVATYSVPANLVDVVIDDSGYAYVSSTGGSDSSFYGVNLSTGMNQAQQGFGFGYGSQIKLHPAGDRMYAADRGISPSDVERINVTNGLPAGQYDSPYHGDFEFCGDLWLDDNGERMLTRCRVVVLTTNQRTTDLTYNMTFAVEDRIEHADFSPYANAWLTIGAPGFHTSNDDVPSAAVSLLDADSGLLKERINLPFVSGNSGDRLMGRFVFADNNSSAHVVIALQDGDDPTSNMLLMFDRVAPVGANLPPQASASRFHTTRINQSVALDARASTDPESDALSYQWTLKASPASSTPTISSPQSVQTEFRTNLPGLYEYWLTVSDGNSSSAPATVTINVFDQTQELIHRLDGSVADAEYSAPLNAMVLMFGNRQSLEVLDMNSLQSEKIPLSRPGYTVGIAPNGLTAAVSHQGMVSLVDLQAGTVIDTQAVPHEWGDVVLDRNNRAHLVSSRDQFTNLFTIDFLNDTVTNTDRPVSAGSQLRLHPVQDWLYAIDEGALEKFDISQPVTVRLDSSRFISNFRTGLDSWISETGDRIVSQSANSFNVSNDETVDMTYAGALSDSIRVQWADHSASNREWAVISQSNSFGNDDQTPENSLLFYDEEFLVRQRISSLYAIPDITGNLPAQGSRVFFSADSQKVMVLTHAKERVNEFAVEVRNR